MTTYFLLRNVLKKDFYPDESIRHLHSPGYNANMLRKEGQTLAASGVQRT